MQKVINPFVYNEMLVHGVPNSTIPAWLNESYSQAYEDILIESLLRAQIRLFKRTQEQIGVTYIEVGANHPVCTSSTYLLNKKYKINGLLVEANPHLIGDLKKHRPNDVIINAAVSDSPDGSVDFYIAPENEISSMDHNFVKSWKDGRIVEKVSVPTVRINNLLEMVKHIDLVLLFIDVEGYDIKILEDIDFSLHRPFVIQTEPSDPYAPGTSTKMVDYLERVNYRLALESNHNLIFIDSERCF